jgi:predicted ATPase/DNA-binding SARP family transcriptional activator
MLHVRLFGHIGLSAPGISAPDALPLDAQRLCAYLLLHRDRQLPAAGTALRLWPSETPENAVARLRRTLEVVARLLPSGEPCVIADSETVGWNPAARLWLDVDEFRELFQRRIEGRQTLAALEATLDEALALVRGPLLADWRDDWLDAPRAELQAMWMELSLEHGALRALRGDLRGALATLPPVIGADPLTERTVRAVAGLHYITGNRAAALRQLAALRHRLKDALATDPVEKTDQLEAAIRAEAASDLVFEAIFADLVPDRLRTGPDAPQPQHTLPAELSSFVGRDSEIRTLLAQLAANRMVSLVGAGGAGKTRLALRTAWRIVTGLGAIPAHERAPAVSVTDGVWWCDLVSIADADGVAAAVLEATGRADERSGEPGTGARRFFLSKAGLLVLDNCEHLAAPVAALVRELLEAAPALRVLATSREVLGVPGEVIVPVEPLAVPPDGVKTVRALLGYPAARLFAERAAEHSPEFSIETDDLAEATALLQRLEGLPLAVELAAARTRSAGLPALVADVDAALLTFGDPHAADGRHATLGAVVDWSYRLLTDEQRDAFAALAVFDNSFTREAAAQVTGLQPTAVGAHLDALASKSMLQVLATKPEPRFRMLDVIRRFGRQRLAAAGNEPAVRGRAVRWAIEVAAEAESAHGTADYVYRLNGLDHDTPNLRGALRWSHDHGPAADYLELAAALGRYWLSRGRLEEGLGWLEPAIARGSERHGTEPLARALRFAGLFRALRGDPVTGAEMLERSLALRRTTDDPRAIIDSQNTLGVVLREAGRHTTAERHLNEALALAESNGETMAAAGIVHNQAMLAADRGALAEAERLYARCRVLARAVGDQSLLAYALNGLGQVAGLTGRLSASRDYFAESLTIRERLGDTRGIAVSLTNLAETERRLGFVRLANRHLRASVVLWQDLGEVRGWATALINLGRLAQLEENLDEASTHLAAALRLAQELAEPRLLAGSLLAMGGLETERGNLDAAASYLRNALGTALDAEPTDTVGDTLAAFAALAAKRHEPRRAAALLGAAEAAGMSEPEREDRARLHDALRRLLGSTAFDVARQSGRSLPRADLPGFVQNVGAGQDSKLEELLEESLLPEPLWQRAAPIVAEPQSNRRGRPRASDREVLAAILYKFRTGLAWHRLPDILAPPSTAHDRYLRWTEEGVLDELVAQGIFSPEELGLL